MQVLVLKIMAGSDDAIAAAQVSRYIVAPLAQKCRISITFNEGRGLLGNLQDRDNLSTTDNIAGTKVSAIRRLSV